MLTPPILDNKDASSPSVFVPSALLREARRQKHLATVQVPPVCLVQLRSSGRASVVQAGRQLTIRRSDISWRFSFVVLALPWASPAASALRMARSANITTP